jgi:hypothetical protein
LSRPKTTAVLVAVLVALAGCSGIGGSGPATPSDHSEMTATDEPNASAESGESALSGRMLVVVEGTDHHLDTSPESDFWFGDTNRHTWHASESMSLAAALETAGVQAENDSLTIDGTTYNESENTTITYRVAGTEIEDPSAYQLENLNPAHEIVVRVDTTGQQASERLVEQSHPHPHGQLSMQVEGESVDFTQERHTMASESFHFHGDEGAARWHAHSLNVTLGAALSTFPGITVSEDAITYNGTTYQADGSSSSHTVTVNGEPVNPNTYVLKDGDRVDVTLNATNQ